ARRRRGGGSATSCPLVPPVDRKLYRAGNDFFQEELDRPEFGSIFPLFRPARRSVTGRSASASASASGGPEREDANRATLLGRRFMKTARSLAASGLVFTLFAVTAAQETAPPPPG